MFPIEGGQKHPVWDTKVQWGSKKEDGYRAESEKESCVKDRHNKKETNLMSV